MNVPLKTLSVLQMFSYCYLVLTLYNLTKHDTTAMLVGQFLLLTLLLVTHMRGLTLGMIRAMIDKEIGRSLRQALKDDDTQREEM